jgi:hypothetical protein
MAVRGRVADERLRSLERRFRATRSVEDEVEYLRERLRVGELDAQRLDLAATCGHDAARALSSRRPYDGDDLWVWGQRLGVATDGSSGSSQAERINSTTTWAERAFARQVCVRACVAAAECVVDVAADELARECLSVAQEWVKTRSHAAADRASAMEEAADEAYRRLMEPLDFDDGLADAPIAALLACARAAGAVAMEGMDLKAIARTVNAAARVFPRARVRAAVNSALIRWALGPRGRSGREPL